MPTVDCGQIAGAATFLITDDQAFHDKIAKDIAKISSELKQRAARLARMDLRDAFDYLLICPPSAMRENYLNEVAALASTVDIQPMAARQQTQRLLRQILDAGMRSKPSYEPDPSVIRTGAVVENSDQTPGPDLALYDRGARAKATFTNWVLDRLEQNSTAPDNAIDGMLNPPPRDQQPWGGVNTAWYTTTTKVEPYPVFTVTLDRSHEISSIRIKQYLPSRTKQVGIQQIAVEFVEDGTVEFFELPDTDQPIALTFPQREARTIRFVPLAYNPDTTHFGLSEIQIFEQPDPVISEVTDVIRHALTREHIDHDLSRFGW